MQQENVLDLPEIRAIVGSFLCRQDLIICGQVCQSWRQSFKPLVWRETVLRSSHNPTRSTYLPPPPLSVVHGHGHLIRSLVLEGPTSREEVLLGLGCTRLEHLRLSATVSSNHGHNNNTNSTNNHINNSRLNNNAGTGGLVSAAGRWNWLLLADMENGDDGGGLDGGKSDSDQETDHGGSDNSNSNNNDQDSGIEAGEHDGMNSDDSYWSSWNYSEDEDDEWHESGNSATGPSKSGGGRIDMWKSLAELVLQNRATLKELEVVLLSPPPCGIPDRQFWETMIECFPPLFSYSSSTLTSLALVGREIKSADLMLIWRAACPHLTRFELARCKVSEAAAMVMETEPRPPSALRHLRLVEVRGMMPRTQFKVFVGGSPRLRSLVWQLHRSHAGLAPTELWASLFQGNNAVQDFHGEQEPVQQWTELTSVELASSKESLAVSDQQLAILLDRAGDTMERLGFGAVQVGELTFRSMRRFFDSLGELDLRLCSSVTGAMVQQVLASCPGLKSIAADSIHASDIWNGDHWVCLDLQSWTVFIDLSVSAQSSSSSSGNHPHVSRRQGNDRRHRAQKDESNVDKDQERLQQRVFERLSTLTNLRHLDLDRQYPLTGRALKAVETLDWRLRRGLDRLGSLSHLSTLSLSSHQTMNMSKSAAVWMIEHWPNLEAVRGRLGERKADHKEVAMLFQRNGIKID
ncbi:hypothetical protein BGX23_007309 [Mortierella sp. AD031]|nr:hypothetical protein BGX23_007309 [Mortierella sp. AD031]